jgi:hydrogenase maturation protein HypF
MEIRKQINVSGIVQGVGFRPFVYRLARSQSLTGSIRNTSAGVSIEIQGIPPAVANFVQRLSSEAPPLARITGISVRETPCSEDADFRLLNSTTSRSSVTANPCRKVSTFHPKLWNKVFKVGFRAHRDHRHAQA